jgi:hypothetical protein
MFCKASTAQVQTSICFQEEQGLIRVKSIMGQRTRKQLHLYRKAEREREHRF